MATAQGQFTIIDYNDAVTLTGFIGSNLSKTQMFSPDTEGYVPDWSETNLVLTPSLFKAGGGGADLIGTSAVTSVQWYKNTDTTPITNGGNYSINAATHALTVKDNVMEGQPGIDFRCVISYYDETTKLTLAYTTSISFSRVVNGSGIAALDVTTPNGNIFKNGAVAYLTAKAELWRGSTVDNEDVTYQWYKQDASVTSDQGGGIGWRKLSNATNSYMGVTTNTLTVYAGEVDSYATFKCVATDTDSTSATYGNSFTNTASFADMNDPIYVQIAGTGGSFFKNGEGSTTLTALVYRNGEEITAKSYSWSKYDKNGVLDTSFGSHTTKSISIGSNDVDVKATFVCNVVV